MPAAQDRQQIRSEELPEYPITGPFGGIQSELPLDQIENYGFADSTNFLFRKGVAYVRPSYTILPPFPVGTNEPVLGIADFFNKNGVRVQVVMTRTKMLQWVPGSQTWIEITGPGFTGSASQTFDFDVINNTLCFSQGADKVWIWDGIAGAYSQSSVNAPASAFLAEIGLHLMTLNTLEGGNSFTQRYRWSAVGDPTDWISFSAGANDNFNNLGPGQGLIKLGQYGYGFHFWGILQIQPTGIGLAPFYFTPVANCSIGNFCPRSLDHFNREGVECAAYIGRDNVYIFNQTSVIPIGDMPIDGRRRIGARSRIIADLLSGDPSKAFGFVTQNIKGQVFNAYWIVIPNLSTWVYNFDESNWTRFSYAGTQTVAGNFLNQTGIRIIDLVGQIKDQNWTPATLNPSNPYDGFALGFDNGKLGYVDFTNYSEQPAQIVSGKHIFGDRRHSKTVKKFRLTVQDLGQTTYSITVSSSSGDTKTIPITIGTGSGDSISKVVEFSITGLRIQWSVSVPAGQPGAIIEFAPMVSTNGEQRGGDADL